jgi:hypothetical protein
MEALLDEMMPEKEQIKNIGDKYDAANTNLFENEKF